VAVLRLCCGVPLPWLCCGEPLPWLCCGCVVVNHCRGCVEAVLWCTIAVAVLWCTIIMAVLWCTIMLSTVLWCLSDEKENTSRDVRDAGDRAPVDRDYHRYDEQVNVCLDCSHPDMPPLPRKYIRSDASLSSFLDDCRCLSLLYIQ